MLVTFLVAILDFEVSQPGSMFFPDLFCNLSYVELDMHINIYISTVKSLLCCFKKGKTSNSIFQIVGDPICGHLGFRGEVTEARSAPQAILQVHILNYHKMGGKAQLPRCSWCLRCMKLNGFVENLHVVTLFHAFWRPFSFFSLIYFIKK